MIKKLNWEAEVLTDVRDGQYCTVISRIKVIGGWVLHFVMTSKGVVSQTSQFISDRDHEWYILKPVEEKPQPNKLAAADFKAPA